MFPIENFKESLWDLENTRKGETSAFLAKLMCIGVGVIVIALQYCFPGFFDDGYVADC